MSDLSILRVCASYVPVAGPVIGFFNRNEVPEDGALYAFSAGVGSLLTAVTAVALASLGFFVASVVLFGLSGVSLIHSYYTYTTNTDLLEGNRAKMADSSFA